MHIQRHKKLGEPKRHVYTYLSRVALASVKAKVRSATRATTSQSLCELVNRLNSVLRGWTNYHRHGASQTFAYLTALFGGGVDLVATQTPQGDT
jgi:RNA-directed DNA polymerase